MWGQGPNDLQRRSVVGNCRGSSDRRWTSHHWDVALLTAARSRDCAGGGLWRHINGEVVEVGWGETMVKCVLVQMGREVRQRKARCSLTCSYTLASQVTKESQSEENKRPMSQTVPFVSPANGNGLQMCRLSPVLVGAPLESSEVVGILKCPKDRRYVASIQAELVAKWTKWRSIIRNLCCDVESVSRARGMVCCHGTQSCVA